ncbi:type I-F CRISPR-associated helicase Cas3f [Azotobacter salinestris]|uniref:type I-F CRISPR-associated helicase Cas3f n=1 Tax=Azotobacter salinestris TaxID=69964 RepID=UPI0032DF8EC1
MNILLISECSKRALTETRRILDQFAERRGERTWQTPITQQGLDTLHRLLRKTARRNTAVACHWIRGKDHSELLWVVGDASRFNTQGAVPTNSTARNVLRREDENDWHTGEDIRLLACLAALFHDLGKANDRFQKKLAGGQPLADPFRHEWVSLRLFEAFVGDACADDRDWLERLARLDGSETAAVVAGCRKDEDGGRHYSPFRTLKHPLARAVGWLIVSHHRLPTPDREWPLKAELLARLPASVAHDWCGSRPENDKARQACWTFGKGLPFDSRHWRQHVGETAAAILKRPALSGHDGAALLASSYTLHLSRLVLMLADHYYSSQPSHARYGDKPGRGKAVHANTRRNDDGKTIPNQRLDEHLIGVGVNASRLMQTLPRLEHSLPRIARHKGFRARSGGAYRWQNNAFDLAQGLRETSAEHGFFGINMASTGCGKTLANGRILYGLANPRLGARFSIALGLRTLTLQTGDAYRERLNLGAEDLAVLVGGAAVRALHEHHRERHASSGSESAADLLPTHSHVRFEGSLEDGPLKRWLYPETGDGRRGRDATALLDAPVLVCTVDHLMPATESSRGGHQILPMLRLMTSDLVLDEPDDFDMADLPALTRLVHWAGLLGSRVLLSSATLPPALVQGLFLAYCAGRREFQRHRGRQDEHLAVCCAWFDEYAAVHGQHADEDAGAAFLMAHETFVERRIAKLAQEQQSPRRRAAILPVPVTAPSGKDAALRQAQLCSDVAGLLLDQALTLHRTHHSIDPATGKRVSFGLIRMANIDPLFDVALALFASQVPAGQRIHLCPYHSRYPLLVRSAIEQELDGTLKRHDEPEQDKAVFARTSVRSRLDAGEEEDHLFIVLATAVAEVGRDHDYDWAIVEPSSMRSIIQLAGRVKRHRKSPCPPKQPNILLLDTNIKHLKHGDDRPAFTKPGFETGEFPLKTHRLAELLEPQQWQVIDARARIRPRSPLDASGNLADLEHARLADLMLGAQSGQAQIERPVNWWWTTSAHLTGVLQQHAPFRHNDEEHQTFALLPDEDCTAVQFSLLPEGPRGTASPQPNLFHPLDNDEVMAGKGIAPWGVPDYLTALQALAEALDMEVEDCARKFGTVDLPAGRETAQRWRYHPALGFSRLKG